MARTRFNHAYKNDNDLIAFDEFADQIQALPRAKLMDLFTEADTKNIYGLPDMHKTRFRAVVSEDGQQEYNSVTESYSLAQHQDVMFEVLNTIQSAGIDGNARIKAFGGKCYMDMVFSNLQLDDPSGTVINLGYTARNTYDGTGGINLYPFAIRGICSNGMIFKMTKDLGLNVIGIKHMGDIAEKVKLGMKQIITQTMQIEGVFATMIERATGNVIEFTANELEMTMSEYTGSRSSARKIIEELKLPVSGELNQWQIYNAMTEYATWNVQSGSMYDNLSLGAERFLGSTQEEMKAAYDRAVKTEELREARKQAKRIEVPLTT